MVAIFAMFAPDPLVHLLATYSIVVLGWILGLMIGVHRRKPDGTRYPIVLYGATTFLAALGLTVPAAGWLAEQPGFSNFGAQALLFPVAAFIPAMSPDWPRIFNFVRAAVARHFSAMLGGSKGAEK